MEINKIDNLISTITEKVLEKPIIELPNVSLSFTDFMFIGIVVVIAYSIHLIVKLFLTLQVKRDRIKRAQSRTLSQLFGYLVALGTVGYLFSFFGYSLTYFVVGSTALLVGLGFGLQQLFVDLISGVILLIDRNLNYGDVVTVNIPATSDKLMGKIVNIGLRATQIETIDKEILIVPNSKIMSNSFRSLMRENVPMRFRSSVMVSPRSDFELAKSLMLKATNEVTKAEKNKENLILIKDFTDKGVVLESVFWSVEIFNNEHIISEIKLRTVKYFRENGVFLAGEEKRKGGGEE